jgi:hypothetical protein
VKPKLYKGFSIEKEADHLYAVRYHDGSGIMDDFKPWCSTIAEAKMVINKILEQTERWIDKIDEMNRMGPHQ